MSELTESLKLNSAARQECMRDVHRDLLPIEAEIDKLRKRAASVKKRLKDYEIPLSAFNLVRRFVNMDELKRDTLMDTLREGFKALQPGAQHDFLGALDQPGIDTARIATGDTTDVERPSIGDWEPPEGTVTLEVPVTAAQEKVIAEARALSEPKKAPRKPRAKKTEAADDCDSLPTVQEPGEDDQPALTAAEQDRYALH